MGNHLSEQLVFLNIHKYFPQFKENVIRMNAKYK